MYKSTRLSALFAIKGKCEHFIDSLNVTFLYHEKKLAEAWLII